MSFNFDQQYYPFSEQGLLLPSHGYSYGHDDGQRSKSPMSMVNNPRHSPGPLSTPPHSRNSSHPPEQVPEQMTYDDTGGSQSDSPTSVPTPGDDFFDFDMQLDESIRDLHHQNGAIVSTQMQSETISALDTNLYVNNPVFQQAFSGSMMPHNTQYQTSSDLSGLPLQSFIASQLYDQFYGQNYTTQHPHHEPWTSQRPQMNPNVPRPGGVMFDPETDTTVDYSRFVNMNVANVNNWTYLHTDPSTMISPSEAQPPPQDYVNLAQHQQIHQIQRPMVPSLVVPQPQANRAFVSLNQTSPLLVDESFGDGQIAPPSMDTSSIWSSTGQLPGAYQTNISPQHSTPSPAASGFIIPPYQHSDSGTTSDGTYGSDMADAKALVPSSPAKMDCSPRIVPEMSFDATPEPTDKRSHRVSKTTGRSGRSGRPGGRTLGTHLNPSVAKAAHDMRRTVACWHCVLQRDKCGPGEICERCSKRSQRPNADCGLGCSRVKLIELSEDFLPTLITQMHEDSHLTHFVNKHIQQWGNVELTIYMTCGQNHMPRIPVKVYEFVPSDNGLLVQLQYVTDPATQKRVLVKKQSPALGMVNINHNEEKRYDKYIDDIVKNHLDAFSELAWMEDDNDFQQKLFKLMIRVKCKNDDERKLLHEVFRFIVVTFIMSHTLTIAEETKHNTLSKMHSYHGAQSYVQDFTSPRMTNRQLKYFFSRIRKNSLATVLNKLQQIFKSSKGCDKWLAAFVAVLGLCMAHEDQQQLIHTTMSTKANDEGLDARDAQKQAEIACREIDERMSFIYGLFRWKYNRKCNPIRDAAHAWDREVGFGDQDSVTFVRQVSQLVLDNTDFLQKRQIVSISHDNQTEYTSRLVSRFLLSFWAPQI